MRRSLAFLVSLGSLTSLLTRGFAAAEESPPLRVPAEDLADALSCPSEFTQTDREPILLVHGTTVTADENWSWNYLPALARDGFDACTVDLPDRAMVDIQISSEYVVFAVREIASRTGRRVDLAGVSQGGLEPRWAIKWWPDIRPLVDDLVMIVTPNHGFDGTETLCVDGCPPSIWQMRTGSNFVGALNAGDETPDDHLISYTSVYSLTDLVVTPQVPESTSTLDGAENIAIQDVCPGRPVDHVQSGYDRVVYALVLDAFSHLGTAKTHRVDKFACTQAFMPGVDPAEALPRHALVYAFGVPMAKGITYPKTSEEPPLAPYAREAES